MPHFVVLVYDAVDQVLNNPRVFSNRAFEPTLGAAFGHTVSVMDPPEHTAYRKILQKAFRPNIVQAWGNDIVAPVIDELVGVFRETGRAELVEQFARPYPFDVIYRMLDSPTRGHRDLLQAHGRTDHHVPDDGQRARRIRQARPLLHRDARSSGAPTRAWMW